MGSRTRPRYAVVPARAHSIWRGAARSIPNLQTVHRQGRIPIRELKCRDLIASAGIGPVGQLVGNDLARRRLRQRADQYGGEEGKLRVIARYVILPCGQRINVPASIAAGPGAQPANSERSQGRF